MGSTGVLCGKQKTKVLALEQHARRLMMMAASGLPSATFPLFSLAAGYSFTHRQLLRFPIRGSGFRFLIEETQILRHLSTIAEIT